MRITKNQKATLMESGKAFYEKLAKDGVQYLMGSFEKKGWKVENFEILSLNYFFRPYGETQSKVSIYEVRFTIDIIPTPQAETIEVELATMKTVRLEDTAETAGTGTIITLSLLLGMFIFGWLTAKEFKYMVEMAVVSPYGENFFKTINWGLGFGIAAIVAVVVIYIMGLLKGD